MNLTGLDFSQSGDMLLLLLYLKEKNITTPGKIS
jgi:hypothetical protein